MSEEAPPRRLRAADVIDQLQHTIDQLTTRSGEPYVTVEHTLNAKGDTQTSVKVSAPMGHDLEALRDYASAVEVIALDTYSAAVGRYPRANGDKP